MSEISILCILVAFAAGLYFGETIAAWTRRLF